MPASGVLIKQKTIAISPPNGTQQIAINWTRLVAWSGGIGFSALFWAALGYYFIALR